MDTAAGAALDAFGSTILVEVGVLAGYDLGGSVANHYLVSKPIDKVLPMHSSRFETTAIKKLMITLKYKHILIDASVGFFRASSHSDPSLFSSVKDYMDIEKGWFNPYLFASNRRPVIPRSMKPDVIFCHGPWLKGDYSIGATFMKESASVIALVAEPPPEPEVPADPSLLEKAAAQLGALTPAAAPTPSTSIPGSDESKKDTPLKRISGLFTHSRTPSGTKLDSIPAAPQPVLAQLAPPQSSDAPHPQLVPPISPGPVPTTMIDRLTDKIGHWGAKDTKGQPDPAMPQTALAADTPKTPPQRRMVICVVGIEPHRVGIWTR